jgi:hypothetical protein
MDVKEGEIVMIINIPDWNKYKYKLTKPEQSIGGMKANFINEWYRDTEDGVMFSKDAWDRIRNKDKYEVIKLGESIVEVKYI